MTKFYDTSSLLLKADSLFDTEEEIIISSITLKELERIKTDSRKDENIKYAARQLLTLLDNNPDKYKCQIYRTHDADEIINSFDLDLTDDIRILASAVAYQLETQSQVMFITNDRAFKHIAMLVLGAEFVDSIKITDDDDYTGFKNITMSSNEMGNFYTKDWFYQEGCNKYGVKINEYINIFDEEHNLVDTRRWDGLELQPLKYEDFNSNWFGKVKPMKNDIYQAMFADSLMNNKITMVKGPAGSGKTYLSLAYLFNQLDRGKIDKIIIFCNPVAAKNSARLGFYPGTRDEKLLDSQIGNLLASKIGSKIMVERLIDDEKLVLLPFADIRGYDTTGMNAGIYISEAQNLDTSLLKLALQRAGEDCTFIIDGDMKTQVDLADYEGSNNGMRRASKVFRGSDIYGEITLQKIHRSRIARIAEAM